jgi:hypothetical protein
MANPKHLAILQQGVEAWNAWRENDPDVNPDLSEADHSKANLTGANLTRANFDRAHLIGANLFHADLTGAHLTRASRSSFLASLPLSWPASANTV